MLTAPWLNVNRGKPKDLLAIYLIDNNIKFFITQRRNNKKRFKRCKANGENREAENDEKSTSSGKKKGTEGSSWGGFFYVGKEEAGIIGRQEAENSYVLFPYSRRSNLILFTCESSITIFP